MYEVLKFVYNGVMHCTLIGASEFLRNSFGVANAVPVSQIQASNSYSRVLKDLSKTDIRFIPEIVVKNIQESNGIFELLGNIDEHTIYISRDFITVDDVYVMADDHSVIGKSFLETFPKESSDDSDEEFPAYISEDTEESSEVPIISEDDSKEVLALSENSEEQNNDNTGEVLALSENTEVETVSEVPVAEAPVEEEVSVETIIEEQEEIVEVAETVAEQEEAQVDKDALALSESSESESVSVSVQPTKATSLRHKTKSKNTGQQIMFKKKTKLIGCTFGKFNDQNAAPMELGSSTGIVGCVFGRQSEIPEKPKQVLPTLKSKETLKAEAALAKQILDNNISGRVTITPIKSAEPRVPIPQVPKTVGTAVTSGVKITPVEPRIPYRSEVQEQVPYRPVARVTEPVQQQEDNVQLRTMLDSVIAENKQIAANQEVAPTTGTRPNFIPLAKEPPVKEEPKVESKKVEKSPPEAQPVAKKPLKEFLSEIDQKIADFLPQIPKPLLLSITAFTSSVVDENALKASGYRYCMDNRWTASGDMFAVDIPKHKTRYFYNKLTGVGMEIPLATYKDYLQYV